MKHKLSETINNTLTKDKERMRMKKMRKTTNRKMRKRSIALVLATVFTLSMGTTAMAAEQPAVQKTTQAKANQMAYERLTSDMVNVGARAASGYAAHYTDALKGSFYVNVSGSALLGISYMKAWDFPSTADVYVSLYRPDGSTVYANVKLPIGREISKTFSNMPSGRYEVDYSVHGVDKGWIYNSLANR